MEGVVASQHSLGEIRVDALKKQDLIQIFDRAIAFEQKILVLHHNLHSMYLYATMREVRDLYGKADWIYIDGMPVVWMSRAVGLPVSVSHRITLLDYFDEFLEEASRRNWRVYYLGGTEEVLQQGLDILKRRLPNLAISGRSGYFEHSPEVSRDVISKINDFRPDILFVGMGMPLQERWLANSYQQLSHCVVLTCGTTLSYVTGDSFRPPAWAGKLGLYGIIRLLSEPKRLWRRYLVEPFCVLGFLAPGITRQLLRRK